MCSYILQCCCWLLDKDVYVAVALERTAWQQPVSAGAISDRGKLQVIPLLFVPHARTMHVHNSNPWAQANVLLSLGWVLQLMLPT